MCFEISAATRVCRYAPTLHGAFGLDIERRGSELVVMDAKSHP
jgi:hypothetical protein